MQSQVAASISMSPDWAKFRHRSSRRPTRTGALAAEAMMKFRWEPDALLSEKNRAHARRNSRAGVKQRLENKARCDQALAARVRDYHRSHPGHTRRTMAKNLLPPAKDGHIYVYPISRYTIAV